MTKNKRTEAEEWKPVVVDGVTMYKSPYTRMLYKKAGPPKTGASLSVAGAGVAGPGGRW